MYLVCCKHFWFLQCNVELLVPHLLVLLVATTACNDEVQFSISSCCYCPVYRFAGDDDASNTNSSYSRCPNSFNVHERALYEMEGNMVNMLVVFSPARKTPPSLVRVHYSFKEENGAVSINICGWKENLYNHLPYSNYHHYSFILRDFVVWPS